MIIFTLLLGCALSAHRSGLVSVDGEQVTLMESTGKVFSISSRGEGEILGAMEQCVVDVRGLRVGKWLFVRGWDVVDAGDGIPPFVGVLRRYGGNWTLEDLHSGQTVLLDPKTVGSLSQEEGRLVLVRGMVVGAQLVAVVAWRALEGEPDPR